MSQISSIKLPDLLKLSSHFQLRVNPNYEKVTKDSRNWILKHAGKLKSLYEKVNFELLAAFLFPEVEAEEYRACCDLINLFVLFDDFAEESFETARKLGDEILSGIFDKENEAKGLGVLSRDLFTRIKNFSSPSNFAHLLDIFTTQIDEVCAESKRREDKIILDFKSYMKVRPLLSGAELVYAMIPCAMKLRNPRELLYCEIFQEMETAAIEMGWIGNDVYSFIVEYLRNVHDSNVITSVMLTKSCSIQEAIDEVEKIFEDRMKIFMENRKKIMENEEMFVMRKFVEVLENMIIGNLAWSSRTIKYNQEEVLK